MLKFFRNIRQSLLNEGKTSKYFKYAIGEIILVVVGILIALQINNWNERRKQKIAQYQTYEIIKEDLINDVKEVDTIISILIEKKETIDKVLSKTLTPQDLLECERCNYIITGFPDFSIQTRGYELLKNFTSQDNDPLSALNSEISSFYKTNLLEIKIDQSFIAEHLRENFSFWKSNYDWWADFISGNQLPSGYIEYATTSNDYRNRVATYKIGCFELYLQKLKNFKIESQKLIKQMDAKSKPVY